MNMSLIELERAFKKEYLDLLERLLKLESRIPITYTYDSSDEEHANVDLPLTTPNKIGDFMYDTYSKEFYMAIGIDTEADWFHIAGDQQTPEETPT
jgi:hypothetical protein